MCVCIKYSNSFQFFFFIVIFIVIGLELAYLYGLPTYRQHTEPSSSGYYPNSPIPLHYCWLSCCCLKPQILLFLPLPNAIR